MDEFDFKVRIYDKQGCCIFIKGYDDWDDAYRCYKQLERSEIAASEWYIELSQVMRRNWR